MSDELTFWQRLRLAVSAAASVVTPPCWRAG